MTLLEAVVAASAATRATTKRNEKKAALAALFEQLEPDEVEPVVGFVIGEPRQGRIGVGWATVHGLDVIAADEPTVTVAELDRIITALQGTVGTGSQAERTELLGTLLARTTAPEADFVTRLFVGEMRHGALAGVVTDAVAVAAGVKPATVRRAAMLAGDLGVVARMAMVGGQEALELVGLEPLRPVQPMLAATSASVDDAIAEVGEASVEWKLDGARIQVHRRDGAVRIYTRNLNDVTDRLPEVVEVVERFPARSFVLDGEVLGSAGLDESVDPHPPQPFQDTMSRFGRTDATSHPGRLTPHFFDLLHLDEADQIDEPLTTRRARLADLVGEHLVPGVITPDPNRAREVLDDALARGHEGVMVKAAASVYEAGRRGRSWRKVKPVRTLDLVVLAAEWGHGRRTGWLSNLHLGALDAETADYVMVGKTFKGLTDRLLAWQTERFQQLKVRETPGTVWIRPEQVVEVAVDGVQVSTRYPGGVALRFARVKGYRDDKDPSEADTIDDVRALLPGGAAVEPTR